MIDYSLCGAEEIRTLDLYVANVPLSQLSYSPVELKLYKENC